MSDQITYGEIYRLVWRKAGTRRAGEVRNYTCDRKKYRAVSILLDDALMKSLSMRFLVSHWNPRAPEIIVSSDFMSLPSQFREAGIWHEIGHIHYEHHLRGDFTDQTQYRLARLRPTEEGRVMPYEEEADRFALDHVGKDALISFLEHLLETRPSGGRLGWNELGQRELEMKITIIRTL